MGCRSKRISPEREPICPGCARGTCKHEGVSFQEADAGPREDLLSWWVTDLLSLETEGLGLGHR